MARTLTKQNRSVTIAATKAGSTVFDVRYNPTLSTTLTNGTTETFSEGTATGVFTDSTTGQTFYVDQINDDLVTKYK